MKDFNIFWSSLKILIFRGVIMKNQYVGGNYLNMGAWTVCRFKGG